jgi:hypothetical protein
MPFNSSRSERSPRSTPETLRFGGLPVHLASVKAAQSDVVRCFGFGVVVSNGGLDGLHVDLFGRVVHGSHGMVSQNAGGIRLHGVSTNVDESGFQTP